MQNDGSRENVALKNEVKQFQNRLMTDANEIQRLVIALTDSRATEKTAVFLDYDLIAVLKRYTDIIVKGVHLYNGLINSIDNISTFSEVRNAMKHDLKTAIVGLCSRVEHGKSITSESNQTSSNNDIYLEQLSLIANGLREYLYD